MMVAQPEGRCFLVSYRRLIRSAAGRRATNAGRPPYADYSCRPEPDLEHPRPAITGLCRADKLAPRLQVGDTVAYATVKGKYPGMSEPGWRLVAVLRVIERFTSHATAAQNYHTLGFPLSRNLMFRGSQPLSVDLTAGVPADVQPRTLSVWNANYYARSRKYPTVLMTEVLYRNLIDPPAFDSAMLEGTLGWRHLHQNPPPVPCPHFHKLLREVGIDLEIQ